MINSLKTFVTLGLLVMLGGGPAFGEQAGTEAGSVRTSLTEANIYLVADVTMPFRCASIVPARSEGGSSTKAVVRWPLPRSRS